MQSFIKSAITSIIAAGAMAGVATAEEVRWKVPTGFGTSLPALGDQIVEIAEDIGTMTGGEVQLKIFEPKQLVNSAEITQAVKDNKLPAGYTWLGYDQGRIPASVLIAAGRPFSYEPTEFIAWWYEGGGRELGEELYADHGIHPILCGLSGPETAGWYREELTSTKDFDGMKIRWAGLGGKVLQKLGASVTVLPGGELFPALEKGALDATEFATPAVDVKLGFYKVAKYNYFPGWHQPFTAFHLVVNNEVWEGLTDQQRSIVDTACTAGVIKNLARGEALSGPQMIANKSNGVEVREVPQEMLDELQAVYTEVEAEVAASDEDFKRILDAQNAFHNDYQTWSSIGYLPRQ